MHDAQQSKDRPRRINRGIGGKIATACRQDTACETTRFFTRIMKQGGSGDIDYGKAWT